MTSAPSAVFSPAATGWRAALARIAVFLEALDADHFAAPEVRIRHLEARIAQLEAAAQKEV